MSFLHSYFHFHSSLDIVLLRQSNCSGLKRYQLLSIPPPKRCRGESIFLTFLLLALAVWHSMDSDPQVPSQKCAWRLGGLPYCALGPSGAPLNPISAPLWVSFCGSCGFFGCFGSPLARSERLLAPFGSPLAGLCPLWPLVGSPWVTLGRSLTPFALPLAPFGSPLGGLWFSLAPFVSPLPRDHHHGLHPDERAAPKVCLPLRRDGTFSQKCASRLGGRHTCAAGPPGVSQKCVSCLGGSHICALGR